MLNKALIIPFHTKPWTRDTENENKITLEAFLNLKILASLENETANVLFPGSFTDGDYFYFREYSVFLNPHKDVRSSNTKYYKKASIYKNKQQIDKDFIDIIAEENQESRNTTTKKLNEYFKYHNLNSFEENKEILTQQKFLFAPKIDNDEILSIPFYKNKKFFGYAQAFKSKTNKFCLLPITFWKTGKIPTIHMAHIHFPSPAPLFRQDQIDSTKVKEIILNPNLLQANDMHSDTAKDKQTKSKTIGYIQEDIFNHNNNFNSIKAYTSFTFDNFLDAPTASLNDFPPIYTPPFKPQRTLLKNTSQNHSRKHIRDTHEVTYFEDSYSGYIWSSWYGDEKRINTIDFSALNKRDVSFWAEWKTFDEAQPQINMVYYISQQIHDLKVIICHNYAHLFDLPQLERNFKYKIHFKSFIRLASLKLLISPSDKIKECVSLHTKKMKIKNLTQLNKTEYTSPIIHPSIFPGNLCILYADSGIGKTWVAMSIAIATSFGVKAFHTWRASKPHKVLYIDSELGSTNFNDRMAKLISCYPIDLNNDINKKMLNWEHVAGLDISQDSDQKEIEELIDDANSAEQSKAKVSLLILDNLSTLTNFTDSNKSWNEIHKWLKKLAKRSIAVLIVHHTGKDGSQRGGSGKTVTADSVIRLNKAREHPTKISLEVTIEKGRNIYGKEAKPFKIELEPNKKNSRWQVLRAQKNKDEQNKVIIELSGKGWKEADIATELQLSLATVKRRRKALGLTKTRK
ncbi:AAA family ATPase [Maridesulfovibrio sp.]|uniref:AAA family ATPase n=1 Tax=unclassified Maridesulfovibrio TaxID=2794999 RepID=UPI003AFFD7C6